MIDPKDIFIVKVVTTYDGVSYSIHPKSSSWSISKPIGTDSKLDSAMSGLPFRYFKAHLIQGNVLVILTSTPCNQKFS